MSAYYEANRDNLIAYAKAHYEANRGEFLAYARAYRGANREKILAYAKAYREANRERFMADDSARKKADSASLKDPYVRRLLAYGSILSAKDLPPALVEVKRLQLLIKRTCDGKRK